MSCLMGSSSFLRLSLSFDRLDNISSKNRASGVAYTLNPLLHPDGPMDTRTVRATKLVLVSAGAFGSPGILERSGIGAKDVLERVGVKQHIDLPGVGENYQGFPCIFHHRRFVLMVGCPYADHNGLTFKYFAADEAQSIDAILRNEEGAIDGGSVFDSSLLQ